MPLSLCCPAERTDELLHRGCPGIRFACLEIKVILIKLVHTFDITPRDDSTRFVSAYVKLLYAPLTTSLTAPEHGSTADCRWGREEGSSAACEAAKAVGC